MTLSLALAPGSEEAAVALEVAAPAEASASVPQALAVAEEELDVAVRAEAPAGLPCPALLLGHLFACCAQHALARHAPSSSSAGSHSQVLVGGMFAAAVADADAPAEEPSHALPAEAEEGAEAGLPAAAVEEAVEAEQEVEFDVQVGAHFCAEWAYACLFAFWTAWQPAAVQRDAAGAQPREIAACSSQGFVAGAFAAACAVAAAAEAADDEGAPEAEEQEPEFDVQVGAVAWLHTSSGAAACLAAAHFQLVAVHCGDRPALCSLQGFVAGAFAAAAAAADAETSDKVRRARRLPCPVATIPCATLLACSRGVHCSAIVCGKG